MNAYKVIKTNNDYRAAMNRLEKLFDARPGTTSGNEAELLMIIVGDYEQRNFSIEAPTPVEAIRFRMEQMNLRQTDLAKFIGSESRVSEVLNGKRTLTLDMIIALHEGLAIPFESLILNKPEAISQKRGAYSSSHQRASLAREKKVTYIRRKK
jgi:HTH-type transcriptional regulator/antitoxin HigA